MRRFVRVSAFVALALCAAAQAEETPGVAQDAAAPSEAELLREAASRLASRARYAELSQLPSPRDRAMAVLQTQPLVPVDTALLRQAADAAPDDVLVQWLALHLQAEPDDSCPRGGPDPVLADRLLQLDFDNAAAHFPRLLLAVEAGDAAAIDAGLAAMAAATRFDTYLFDLIGAGIQLWRRFPLPPHELPWTEGEVTDAETAFAGQSLMQAVFALPSFMPLVKLCDASSGDLQVDLRRYAVCGDVGRLMSRSPAWIDRSFGYLVLQKSGQLNEADAAARLAYETLRQRFVESVSPVPDAAAAFLRAVTELRDETAAAELVLAALAREKSKR